VKESCIHCAGLDCVIDLHMFVTELHWVCMMRQRLAEGAQAIPLRVILAAQGSNHLLIAVLLFTFFTQ